jgi:hypothetical protein
MSYSSHSHTFSHRSLIIILSTVLGSIGFILVLGTLLFLYRRRRGQHPFSSRGASPINDEEIASWRLNSEKRPQYPPPVHKAAIREVHSAIPLAHSPGWTWTASPTSINTLPNSPVSPFIATAPNARRGLTDEAIPGAVPFIINSKRQSSRLSKPPPMGHKRSRSSRSSISGKSMWSINSPDHHARNSAEKPVDFINSPVWYDGDSSLDMRSSQKRDRDTEGGSMVPGDEYSYDNYAGGGLSPRPRSQHRVFDSREIGRAIS